MPRQWLQSQGPYGLQDVDVRGPAFELDVQDDPGEMKVHAYQKTFAAPHVERHLQTQDFLTKDSIKTYVIWVENVYLEHYWVGHEGGGSDLSVHATQVSFVFPCVLTKFDEDFGVKAFQSSFAQLRLTPDDIVDVKATQVTSVSAVLSKEQGYDVIVTYDPGIPETTPILVEDTPEDTEWITLVLDFGMRVYAYQNSECLPTLIPVADYMRVVGEQRSSVLLTLQRDHSSIIVHCGQVTWCNLQLNSDLKVKVTQKTYCALTLEEYTPEMNVIARQNSYCERIFLTTDGGETVYLELDSVQHNYALAFLEIEGRTRLEVFVVQHTYVCNLQLVLELGGGIKTDVWQNTYALPTLSFGIGVEVSATQVSAAVIEMHEGAALEVDARQLSSAGIDAILEYIFKVNVYQRSSVVLSVDIRPALQTNFVQTSHAVIELGNWENCDVNAVQSSNITTKLATWTYPKITVTQTSYDKASFRLEETIEATLDQVSYFTGFLTRLKPLEISIAQANSIIVNAPVILGVLRVDATQESNSESAVFLTSYLSTNLYQQSSVSQSLFTTVGIRVDAYQLISMIVKSRNYEEVAVAALQVTSSVGSIRDSTIGWVTDPVIILFNNTEVFE